MDNSVIDPELQRIAAHVAKIRATQHACSVNDVALSTRLNKSTAYRRLGEAREAGLIEWTDGVAGSVRCVAYRDALLPAADWQNKLRDRLAAESDEGPAFVNWLIEQLDAVMYPPPTESN
jgi:DNA-binding IclR family transcriptional regulator